MRQVTPWQNAPQHDRPRRRRVGDVVTAATRAAWKRRILWAVLVGALFTWLFSWRVGVTAAVLVAVAHAVYRSRRPAAVARPDAMTDAQRRTARQLARLERAGYRALHGRAIPDSSELIDHLVIGPTGVYAIDSEDWDKRLPVRMKKARQLWHGPFSKTDRLSHARWEARQAGERLTAELGTEITVRPAMAVYGPPIPWMVATIGGVDVFSGGRLRKYLRKDAVRRGGTRLGPGEIERLHAAAARVLPVPDGHAHAPVG